MFARYNSESPQIQERNPVFNIKVQANTMTLIKFKPENMVVTAAVDEWIGEDRGRKESIDELVIRHLQGDWGDLCDGDKEQNEEGLNKGGRLMSSFELNGAPEKIWVITESDRSVLTVLFPSDY